VVEDYHQCLKTGCSIERRQLQSGAALLRFLSFLAPLAVRLLQLRQVTRQTPEVAAAEVAPLEMVVLVASLNHKEADELTAGAFWQAVGRHRGYLGRKGDGPPGLTSLGRGWLYLQTLLQGVQLAAKLPQLKCE
jgi:hypothetical protein